MNVNATARTIVPAATAAAWRQRDSAPAKSAANVSCPESIGSATCWRAVLIVKPAEQMALSMERDEWTG